MRTTLCASAMGWLVLSALLASCPAVAADAPPLPDVVSGDVLSTDVQKLKDRITFWINTIGDAKAEPNAVYAARDMLIGDYAQVDKKGAGYKFAELAAAVAAPVLSKGFGADPLAKAREIGLAMALSQMPRASVQPALEAMVNCDRNPAVRYFGWKGYRQARTVVLGLGPSATQKVLASVDRAARTETSGPALEQLFGMLTLETVKPEVVSKEMWDLTQKRTLAAMSNNWRNWCQMVVLGDEEVAEACQRAVLAVRSRLDWIGQDKEPRKLILQMFVDMGFCAAKGFAQASSDGRPADAFSALLLTCEEALNAATRAGKVFIKTPLEDPKVAANPDILIICLVPGKENCGVLAWADFLKDQGVVAPNPADYRRRTAGTPASGPATRPTPGPGK